MAQSDDEAALPDYVVEALIDQQCREIVSHLSSADGAVTLRELANHLDSPDSDEVASFSPSDPPKRLLVRLHHVHLPKLDEAGLVEYAPEKRRVAYAGEWVLDDVEASDEHIQAIVEGLG